jgi:hypothetical protein
MAEFPHMAELPHIAEFPHMAELPHIAELPHMAELPVGGAPETNEAGPHTVLLSHIVRGRAPGSRFHIAAWPQGVCMSATK